VPFVITTTRPTLRHAEPGTVGVPNQYYPTVLSRRAVATLEEARVAAAKLLRERSEEGKAQGVEMWLPKSGGTIGPLPDGTVIEVERVKIAALAAMVPRLLEDGENVIAAYNAAQETT
jgi:hypothetical protein